MNSLINHEVVQGEYETYTPERMVQDRLGIWRQGRGREAPDYARAMGGDGDHDAAG